MNNEQQTNLILVVDDDDLIRMQLRELLEANGYRVEEARNGEEAITLYTEHLPDIVLLDALMPKVNGFSCCAQLQALGRANIPILMITALSDQESVERAFAAGATDFITKPIQWSVLSQRVRRLLKASQAMQELRQQTERAQSQEAQLRMALKAASMGVWDWDITNKKVTWSENKETLFGLKKGTFDGTYETFIQCIHPEDRDQVKNSITHAVEQNLEYDIEFRVVLPDGNIRWMVSKGVVFCNTAGEAIRMSGIDMDITERKQAQQRTESYANQQTLIAKLSQLALAGTDLTTLMQEAVTLVAQCLKVEYCKVLELLPDGQELLLRARVGLNSGLVGQITVSADQESQAGYTLLSDEPVIVADLRTETRFKGPQLLTDHQVISGISVVIHGRGRTFGVLGVHTIKERSFSRDEVYFLQAVANVLATAIERQQAEVRVHQSEQRFQILARATNDAVWDWDLSTDKVWWNEAVQTLFGYPIEQVENNAHWWSEQIHPQERQRIISEVHAVINSGQQFWTNEYRFCRADGTYADIFDRGYIVRDDAGKPMRIIGAMMDISERKRVQSELQRQNWRSQLFSDITVKIRTSLQIDQILQTSVTEVQKLLHTDRVLILRLQPDNSVMAVKEAVVPGLPVVLGETIIDPCFHESYIEKYAQGRINAITNIYEANIHACHRELLERFSVKANLVVPIIMQNELWGLLIAHHCAHPRLWTDWETELLRQLADQIGIALAQARLLEQETRQRQELTRSNEELQQFAFIASHDLQEPLRKIKAFGDRIEATNSNTLTPQGLDYLQRMQKASLRMQVLIEDLLSLSRVTTKAQPFVEVDLGQVIQEVLIDLELRIGQTNACIEVGELPTIKADPLQMRQLFQNLIGNALKFHRPQVPPVVKIYSQLLPQVETSSNLCEIVVEDNGIGFDEKYLDRIFNIFQRLHGRNEYEGTGIGLAICRKIVERHQGQIIAKSKLQEGAKFIITLPIREETGKKEQ